MLHIEEGHPWLFWPSNVCSILPEYPANKVLTGRNNFEVYLDVTLNKVENVIGTVFALVPHYTAIDIYNGRLLFTIADKQNESTYWDLPVPIFDGIKLRIKWIHKINNTFTVFINDREVHEVNLEEKGYAYEEEPHIIFGAGNFPKNGYNLNYVDINLHEFKVIEEEKLLCHHKFEEFIFDKSVDITDNCNFIHKI